MCGVRHAKCNYKKSNSNSNSNNYNSNNNREWVAFGILERQLVSHVALHFVALHVAAAALAVPAAGGDGA